MAGHCFENDGMKKPVIAALAIVLFALNGSAQEPGVVPAGEPAQAPGVVPVMVYEGYPVLKAGELLKPEFLTGLHHTVMEAVPTQGFSNQYTVQTDWGIFTIHGNQLLAKRIREFDAIASLEEASKSEEFKRSLRAAAAKPFHAIGGALQDPGGAIKGIGAGAGRFLRKAGEAMDREGKKSANTDSTLESVVGYSKTKREIAGQLSVDPYTDNAILQQRLGDMAKASFAGGFAVRAGTFALSAGANSGLASVAGNASFTADLENMVRDNDPLSLSAINREKLMELGVGEAAASAFVEHPIVTPSQQTAITLNLARLGRVEGIVDFLKMMHASRDAADVGFFLGTVKLMASYHEQVSPVKRILNLNDLPVLHAENKALVIPLAVDYGSWSAEADRLSRALMEYKPEGEITQRVLYVSGLVSHRARQELVARGFVLSDGIDIPLYKVGE